LKLGVGLDAFGQHGEAEPASKAQHSSNNGRGLTVGIDRLDERAVDLDLSNGNARRFESEE